MKLREIERLRAVAVLMVVFTHTGPPLPPFGGLGALFQHPRTGVDLFFVISGFVVTLSLSRLLPDLSVADGLGGALDLSRSALRVFYTKRFFRIAPLAVAVVVLQGSLFLVLPPSALGGDLNDYWHEVGSIFTGVYNYTRASAGYSELGVYWSLAVEEHFYLLLPLGFLLARTRSKRLGMALAGIAFVALVCRTFFDDPPPGTADPGMYRICASHLRFDSLLAGVALALASGQARQRALMPPWFIKCLVVPICIALVWAIPRAIQESTYERQGLTATWFLCGILVFYASLDRGYVLQVPVVRQILEYVGARSYAVYLLHIPLNRLDAVLRSRVAPYEEFHDQHRWVHWGLYVAGVIVTAEISWLLLEGPMQRIGRRLTAEPAALSQARVQEDVT